jgi:thiaminase/transcriptional activator TenA
VTLSGELREQTAATWDAAVRHRFVDELWRGEIDPAALTTYLVQDHQFYDAFVALMGAAVAAADRAEPRVVHARQLGLVAGPENDFFARALDCLTVLLVAEWLYLDWASRPGAAAPDEDIQREWIELHRGPAFEAWVEFLRSEFDRVGADLDDAGRERVAALFTRAVDLELAFFEAAYLS